MTLAVLDTDCETILSFPANVSSQYAHRTCDWDSCSVFLCQLANVPFELWRELDLHQFRRVIRHRDLPRVQIQAASRHAAPPASLAGSSLRLVLM